MKRGHFGMPLQKKKKKLKKKNKTKQTDKTQLTLNNSTIQRSLGKSWPCQQNKYIPFFLSTKIP